MPIGGFLQRVTKLVKPSSSGSSSKNSSTAVSETSSLHDGEEGNDHSGGAVESLRRSLEDDKVGQQLQEESPNAHARRQLRDDHTDEQVHQKRPSVDLTNTYGATEGNKSSKRKSHNLPGLQTSSSALCPPSLSLTPATPVTAISPSSGKKEGSSSTTNFQGSTQYDASTTSTATLSQEGKPEEEEEEDDLSAADSPLLPYEQNRNSSLLQESETNAPDGQLADNNTRDKERTGIILEEPGEMDEEEEQRLISQRFQQPSKKASSAGPPAAEASSSEMSYSQEDQQRGTNSDHPALQTADPPTGISSRPSFLSRLPSQVISESPSSDYPPSPLSPPGLTRSSSLKKQYSDLQDAESDYVNQGGQAHLPQTLANAVQGLHNKIAKPSTDYRFPSTTIEDTPETIEEESSSVKSPRHESTNTLDSFTNSICSSPASSSGYLNPSGHAAGQGLRDSPGRDDVSANMKSSPVNEYSTPSGFMKHRRNSSQNAPREVKETPNAGYRDLPDGKRKLNQYVLMHDLGRGSFGTVQIAKDEQTGQEYAAKEFSKMRLRKRQQSEMIRRQAKGSRRGAVPIRSRGGSDRAPSSAADTAKNDLDLIRSEVAIMKKLDHPNVVKLFEVLDVQQDDSLFMIVELCRNGPVMSVGMGQQVEPLSEDTARNYFRQIILAIEYLHENGIIHRDIKPENILKMADNQSIKLVDFGVSEMFSRENEERELRSGGSPAFMAPELCMSGHTKLSGKATDIWALGVTLYCMVVGHLPFESHQMLDLYDKIKTDPVNMPEDLSYDLKDLLLRLLEKDPAKRIRMPELREHKWITRDGRDPLPTTEMNVTSVEEVTESDIDNAIAVPSVSYIINAVRAANRWRRFAARRTQSDGAQSTSGSTASTDLSRSGSHEGLEGGHDRDGSGASSNVPLPQRASTREGMHMENLPEDAIASEGVTEASPYGHVDPIWPPVDVPKIAHPDHIPERQRESVDQQLNLPFMLQRDKAKRPLCHKTAASAVVQKSISVGQNLVDFPEIDRVISQQEYLSQNGIDDSSVEVLRHYEDTTGHMLPRAAVEEITRSRKNTSNSLDPLAS